MTFWGKQEGQLVLREGQEKHEFLLNTESRFELWDVTGFTSNQGTKKIWSQQVSFDHNPADKEPGVRIPVMVDGRELMSFTVERFYGEGKEVEVHTNEGSKPL